MLKTTLLIKNTWKNCKFYIKIFFVWLDRCFNAGVYITCLPPHVYSSLVMWHSPSFGSTTPPSYKNIQNLCLWVAFINIKIHKKSVDFVSKFFLYDLIDGLTQEWRSTLPVCHPTYTHHWSCDIVHHLVLRRLRATKIYKTCACEFRS